MTTTVGDAAPDTDRGRAGPRVTAARLLGAHRARYEAAIAGAAAASAAAGVVWPR